MAHLTKNRIGGVLLLAFCALYAWRIEGIVLLPFQEGQAFTARTVPVFLSILGIGLAVLTIVLPHAPERPKLRGLAWGQTAVFLALMSGYGLAIRPLGFLIATSAFLMLGFAILGERRPAMLVAVAVPMVVAFWVLMTQVLEVYIAPWPAALS